MRRILWTLVPVVSLGLLGWVPPMRIAFSRRTPAAWLWFAGSVGGSVLVAVLASTVQQADKLKDNPSTWPGLIYLLVIMVTATYTAITSKALAPKPGPADMAQRPSRRQDGQDYRDSGYGRYPARAQAYPSSTSPMPDPVATAAEVQAELRQLRDLLGESAGARAAEARDRQGER